MLVGTVNLFREVVIKVATCRQDPSYLNCHHLENLLQVFHKIIRTVGHVPLFVLHDKYLKINIEAKDVHAR